MIYSFDFGFIKTEGIFQIYLINLTFFENFTESGSALFEHRDRIRICVYPPLYVYKNVL